MRLRYTLRALDDLSSILGYLAERSPVGAKHVRRRLQVVIGLLPEHPNIGTPTDDPTIRRLIALPYPYLIFYELGDNEVIIHTIRHSSRDAPDTAS